MNKFICCFCDMVIKDKVTALIAEANWYGNEEDKESQQLFCHLECLRKAVAKSDYLYIDE